MGAGTRGPDETAYRQSLVVPGLQTADTKVSRSRRRQTRGSLGIMRAVERYDPTQGTPFLAWAHTWVRQASNRKVLTNRLGRDPALDPSSPVRSA